MKTHFSSKKISGKKMLLMLVAGVFMGSALLLSSCQTSDQDGKEDDKKKAKKDRFRFLEKEQKRHVSSPKETIEQEKVSINARSFDEAKLKQLEAMTARDTKKAITAGKKSAWRSPSLSGPRFYDDFILLNADEVLDVSLVFNSAPILDVIPAFADVLGFNFVADSDLRGVVTLNLNSKMTRKELWATFESLLLLSNATAKAQGSLLRVMLQSKVNQQPDSTLASPAGGEIYYRQLQFATGREAMQQLKPFLRRDAICVEMARPNAIMVCDIAENIPKIRQILELVDSRSKSSWVRALIPCRNILPSKIADELRVILPTLGFTVYQTLDRTEAPGAIQVSGIDRIQVLAVTAATEEAMSEIRKWVELLDSSDSLDQEMVFVYKVRHGKVEQLAQALAVIYDSSGSTLTIDTNSGRQRTTNLSAPRLNTNNRYNPSRMTANTTATGARGSVVKSQSVQTDQHSSLFNTSIRIFADGVLNRMIVRTTPRTYASIKSLLDRLDVVPAQVLLQVLVVEVTLSDSNKFGIEWSMTTTHGDANSIFGTNYSSLNPDMNAVGGAGDRGFSFLISNPKNPSQKFGYIKALAGNSALKVVSSPQLLVSSNTEAKIQVGQKVPYVAQGTSSTSSTQILQNYEYEDVGVILTVTPQITSTELISLEVKQELSEKVDSTDANIQSPTFNKRIVETAMTIANGQTMVIGGLIQEKTKDSLDSLPIINQIPVLNRLVGNTDASVERSEVLVMITGHIINEKSPVQDMIKRYNSAIDLLNDYSDNLGTEEGSGKKFLPNKPSLFLDKDFWL